jgi:DNA-binding response OmpR family regulator
MMLSTVIDMSDRILTGLKKPDLLIVDDDPDIRTVLHDLLEAEGYAVTDASTCQEALLHALTQPYNAVLLDIGLPDGNGLSLLSCLRKMIPSLAVIMLTASTTTDVRADSLARGAFAFLEKPYDHNELRLLIRRALVAKVDSARPGKKHRR